MLQIDLFKKDSLEKEIFEGLKEILSIISDPETTAETKLLIKRKIEWIIEWNIYTELLKVN